MHTAIDGIFVGKNISLANGQIVVVMKGNEIRKIFFLIFIILNSFSIEVYALTDEQIIRNNVPPIFFTLNDFSTQKNLTKDEILFKFLNDTFGNKDGSRFLIVVYSSGIGVEPDSLTDLRVIKISKNGTTTLSPKIDYKLSSYPFDAGCEISLQDLDGDGINEVLAKDTNWRDSSTEHYIFKWSNKVLVDITPIIKDDSINLESSGLLDMGVSTFTIEGKHLLYSRAPTIINKEFGADQQRIYQFRNGNLEEQGTFEYLTNLEKLNKGPAENVEVATLSVEGEYTLEVENISDHKDGVRAEVTINTNVVMKPADFCNSGLFNFFKKDNGDNSDANEDHLNGCKTKTKVSVNITLMKVNTIKVKLFGKKGSRIQVTLKKKS